MRLDSRSQDDESGMSATQTKIQIVGCKGKGGWLTMLVLQRVWTSWRPTMLTSNLKISMVAALMSLALDQVPDQDSSSLSLLLHHYFIRFPTTSRSRFQKQQHPGRFDQTSLVSSSPQTSFRCPGRHSAEHLRLASPVSQSALRIFVLLILSYQHQR